MSHVASIDLEIKDLDCLFKAAAELGLEVRAGQTSYRWFGTHVGDYPLPEGVTLEDLGRCEHALGVPNNGKAYEIGIAKVNGKWTLLWDFFMGGYGLQRLVGEGCQKLKQGYAKQVALKQVKKLTGMGWKLTEQKLPSGEIKLSLEK